MVTPQARLYCDTLLDPLPIPDGDPFDGAHDFIAVPPGPAPSQLRVHLRIDHTWVGDLVALVSHPAGGAAVLLDRPGEGLCGGDGVDCVFDDVAANAAQDQCAVAPPAIGGEVRAVESLDALVGENPAGDWGLWVYDDVPDDTGAVVRWCVELR